MATADFPRSGPDHFEIVRDADRPELEQHAWKLAFAVLLAAHAPMVVMQLFRTWQLPRYQFGPLLLAAVFLLAWRRRQPVTLAGPSSGQRLGMPLLCGGLLLLATSAIVQSPWIATAALMFNIAGMLLHSGGWERLRSSLDLWLLTWLAIPLPMKTDMRLIGWLQLVASQMASGVLDLVSLEHRLAGNVFYIRGQQLFVDEACSGVQSLFGTVACVGILCVWNRYGLLRSFTMLAAAGVWVPVVNAFRVLLVVHVNSTTSLDLATGWPHDLLAVVLFPLTLFLVYATDQMTGWFWDPVPESDHRGLTLWNRLVTIGRRHEPLQDAQAEISRATDDDPNRVTSSLPIPALVLGCFLAVGSFQLILMFVGTNGLGGGRLEERPLTQESMPASFGPWKLEDFRVLHRGSDSDEGEHSQQWLYGSPSGAALVSWDYPFVGWHELTHCYAGRGWQVMERRFHAPGQMEAVLRDASGQYAWLGFSVIDGQGQFVPPPDKSVRSLVLTRVASEVKALNWADTTYQLQVFRKLAAEPTTEEREELRGFQTALREQLFAELGLSSTATEGQP